LCTIGLWRIWLRIIWSKDASIIRIWIWVSCWCLQFKKKKKGKSQYVKVPSSYLGGNKYWITIFSTVEGELSFFKISLKKIKSHDMEKENCCNAK
jgi:hypothetical protein